MPFWDRTLDLVVLTHPDDDHLTGLIPALERYAVKALLLRPQDLASDLVKTWESVVTRENATVIWGEAGTHIAVSDGVSLDVLHPGPGRVRTDEGQTNNDSIVLRLVYQDVAVLLTGDIEADVERQLVSSGKYLQSNVLKVPHHGSQTSSCRMFLDAVAPQVAVISVGENTFGHPAKDVLARLQGVHVYRTDENGTVSVASDGHTVWIEAER
jgi:competence protein ComEC